MKIKTFMVLALLVGSSAGAALPKLPDFLHVDGAGSVAYSNVNVGAVTGVSYASSPFLLAYGIGATGAFRFMSMFAGLTSDFRWVNHMSDIKVYTGNMAGTRWNIVSPTFGYRGEQFIVKGDFQFLGSYTMRYKTKAGGEVAYTDPIGGRVTYLHSLQQFVGYPVHAGASAEYVSFSHVNSTNMKNVELATNLAFWQFGLVASYVF